MGDEAEEDKGFSNIRRPEHRFGEGNATMASDKIAVAGLADRRHLDMIDKLFACNVGQYISLPQIVVVGDQSSGKSSVLEGLTRLPFPRDSVLATRFATQIVFRRQPKATVTILIIPDIKAQAEHVTKLQGLQRENTGVLTKEKFSEILSEVHALMGLTSPGGSDSTSTKTFSRDILRIEICGPDQEHLSVIDVPGIFSRTQAGITTKADKTMVTDMVRGYMQNPRSIILAVVPANVDVATQEILEIAEELDPDGQRTLGVMTKPDLVDEGAESNVAEILDGYKHKLNLGWHIIRNPGQKQISDPNLDRISLEEDFFNRITPWKDLEKEKTGIPGLKVRLQDILTGLVRREFPKVKQEISKLLARNIKSLKDLGDSRETREEQLNYLLSISMEFHNTATCALMARYGGNPSFESSQELRLATNIVERNSKFSTDMASIGHTAMFGSEENIPKTVVLSDTESESDESDDEMSQGDEPEIVQADVQETGSGKIEEKMLGTRYEADQEELSDAFSQTSLDVPPSPSKGGRGIWTLIHETYSNSRGFELGTVSPSVLAVLWKKQSVNWVSLALGYIHDAVCIVHKFHRTLLQLVCPNNRVRGALESILLEKLLPIYTKAISQVEFILEVERNGTPQTLNHYFNENLEKCRNKRFADNITQYSDKTRNTTRTSDLIEAGPMSNADHTIRDIHDILESYYKVARKRFVDTVCMQATDYHLLTGKDSPLKVFCPIFVSKLSDDELEMIAGEDVGTKRKRKQLKKEIADLETGKKILV